WAFPPKTRGDVQRPSWSRPRRRRRCRCVAYSSCLPARRVTCVTAPAEKMCLTLQLPILGTSESMGDHDSEIMDDGGLDRGDAGALGVVAARREGSDAGFVHARAGGGVSGIVSGRAPWR